MQQKTALQSKEEKKRKKSFSNTWQSIFFINNRAQ